MDEYGLYLPGFSGGLGITITCEFGTKFVHVCDPSCTPCRGLPPLLAATAGMLAPMVSFWMKFGVSPSPKSTKGSWRGSVEDLVTALVCWVWPFLSVVE